VTNDQLNAAAAKCMGWTETYWGSVQIWIDYNAQTGEEPTIRVDRYKPASNLIQAWEFARAMKVDFGFGKSGSAWALLKGNMCGEPHDGTPQDAARALTTCVLRANGVEV
jgi:hypothetical protein